MTSTQPDKTLTIENFSVFKNRQAIIKDLSLPPIKPGTFCAIMGPNGSGKTTLLQGLAQLTQTTGTYRYNHVSVPLLKQNQRTHFISYLPQSPINAAHLTIFETMRCSLLARHPTQQDIHAVIEKNLHKLDLHNKMYDYLDGLSGGQRQRVAIAQILACNTPITLLDEPLNNLDPKSQYDVMEQLKEIVLQEKKTIFLTLHDLNMALRLTPYVALLKEGNLIAFGPSHKVLTTDNIKKTYNIKTTIEEGLSGRAYIDVLPNQRIKPLQ